MSPSARQAASRERRDRAAARTAFLVLVAVGACGLSGCSSTPGEASRPGGLMEQRQILADRRAATRDTMEQGMAGPSVADGAADAGSTVLGWLNGAANTALDVLTLQALGIW